MCLAVRTKAEATCQLPPITEKRLSYLSQPSAINSSSSRGGNAGCPPPYWNFLIAWSALGNHSCCLSSCVQQPWRVQCSAFQSTPPPPLALNILSTSLPWWPWISVAMGHIGAPPMAKPSQSLILSSLKGCALTTTLQYKASLPKIKEQQKSMD